MFSGVTMIATYEFTRPKDSLEFVGIWTSDAFDRIEVRETEGNVDNEFFGNFSIGRTPLPEPASFALFAAGLLGLVLTKRRR